ncbi:RagB/SusD family nutrient uptake outer membrane protein [Olivibacter sp. XZL3]|uniref:RagB/SusD family nutrient uptake outer membrane protein n=1 Tax=Olivibacter sp. XZL3 TaxID=1735116 RepID=UPI0010656468|nr:RagB/SusD family nutrient uptake outer membrane protein [Olivibacter sp. XZL3]
MKKFFSNSIVMLALLMAMSGCSKDYLETRPTNQVSADEAFSTTTNVWAALNGIHRIMYSQIFGVQAQGGQSGNMLYMDIIGDDMVFNNTSSSWLRNEYQWIGHRNPTERMLYYNYQFYYVIIGNANMILANVDQAEGPEEDKAILRGQALVYRAWSYYQMVQLFGERYVAGAANDGLGVPLVLEPSQEMKPRNTVEEVYTQINADLDAAIPLLEGYTRANKSHLDSHVAKGIKARVALTQGNWELAASNAREARAGFNLMTNAAMLEGFNNYDNQEWMWASRIQSDQTNYFYSFFAYMSSNYNSTVIRTSPKSVFSVLYNRISDTDIRKKWWDPTGENTEEFRVPENGSRYRYMSRKFVVADESLSIGDVPYMRAAEMYLIEAEALARSGNEAAAVDVLYSFAVNRDPSYKRSNNTGEALIDEIMVQRRVELWGEGFRFYDLKRTNSPLDREGGNHSATNANNLMEVPAGDKRWQFLIPQDEINNTNGLVVQNPL